MPTTIEQPATATNHSPSNILQVTTLPNENMSSGLQRVAWINGTLSQGEVFTYPVSLEGGYTMFGVQWGTGMGTLHLLDENGNLVDEAFALSHPAIISYTADAKGTTAGGIAFNRETSQLFTVSHQSFSLSGSYSDVPEVQAENPAMYQALAISVGVIPRSVIS
ncbi:MAG: hypothetical protein ACOYYS_09910 [Chloroflexota bacterium]